MSGKNFRLIGLSWGLRRGFSFCRPEPKFPRLRSSLQLGVAAMISSRGLASGAGRVLGMAGALLLAAISAAAAENASPQRPSLRHFWESAAPPRLESAEQERLTSQKRDEAIEQLERIIAKS